jgi:hypothetical protein
MKNKNKNNDVQMETDHNFNQFELSKYEILNDDLEQNITDEEREAAQKQLNIITSRSFKKDQH